MTRFRCLPMGTGTAARFRRTLRDDADNALRRVEATRAGGFPCRHCLRCAEPGDTMLLASYNLPRPRGIYWTPSPNRDERAAGYCHGPRRAEVGDTGLQPARSLPARYPARDRPAP